MKQTKEAFLLYTDTLQVLDEISDSQCATLFKAIAHYHSDGILPEMDHLTKTLFSLFKTKFDVDAKSYNKKIEERSNAGKLGNLKRWNKELYDLVVDKGLPLEEAYAIHTKNLSDTTHNKYGVGRNISHSDKSIAKVAGGNNPSQKEQVQENIADHVQEPLPLPDHVQEPLQVSIDLANAKKEYIRKIIIDNAMALPFYKKQWSFIPDGLREQDYKLSVYDILVEWILHNHKQNDAKFIQVALQQVEEIYKSTSNNPEAVANIKNCIESNKPMLIPDSMRSAIKKIQEKNKPLTDINEINKKFEALKDVARAGKVDNE